MNRRNFASTLSLLSVGVALAGGTASAGSSEYERLVEELLREWCDGMLRHQVNDPDNPKLHGVLECPACDVIHG